MDGALPSPCSLAEAGLDWTVELAPTPATLLMNGLVSLVPGRL